MQIDQDELRRRLGSEKNFIAVVRPGEKVAVPDTPCEEFTDSKQQAPHETSLSTKIVAGSLARQGESIKDIACEFGISTNQVHAAKNSKNPAIKGPIQNSLERVSELAIDKMLLVLGLMTSDKFADTNVKELSIVAANMSRIVSNIRPPAESDNRVQLIIYAPEPRSEKSYRVIDV